MTWNGIAGLRLRKEAAKPEPTTLHVAIIAPDERTARKLRNNVAVYAPSSWPGSVRLHLVIGNGTDFSDQFRIDMADLAMFRHEDLDLIYPVELQVGWENR